MGKHWLYIIPHWMAVSRTDSVLEEMEMWVNIGASKIPQVIISLCDKVLLKFVLLRDS